MEEEPEISEQRLDGIVKAIIGSRDIASILKEDKYVSINDYRPRLMKLIHDVNQVQVGLGSQLNKEFGENLEKLGFINALFLMKYLKKRVDHLSNGGTGDVTEIVKIPGIVAGITNGDADSRCMYDFIDQRLLGKYDVPLPEVERQAKDFARDYIPAPLDFNDAEQMKIKGAIDSAYNGDSAQFKEMMIKGKYSPQIKQILEALNSIEDIEDKEVK